MALNCQSLGANTTLIGVVGEDQQAKEIKNYCQENSIRAQLFSTADKPTTCKTRVVSGAHQLLRFDVENTAYLSEESFQDYEKHIFNVLDKQEFDAIIIEDYDKGALSKGLIESLISYARAHKIFMSVDPKKRHFMDYKKVSLFKPNLKEISEGLGVSVASDLESLDQAKNKLFKVLECENLVVTLSEKGMYLSTKSNAKIIPAHLKSVADVSGAGDTVIAVLTLSMCKEEDLSQSSYLANLSASIVCAKKGVVAISAKELIEALE